MSKNINNQPINQNNKEEKKMTIAENNAINNKVTLSKFGEFIKKYATGTENISLSKATLVENAELLQVEADGILEFVKDFYVEIGIMMDLRQASGKTGNTKETLDELRKAEKDVKDRSDSWFLLVGTRPAKTDKGTVRPAYGTTYADFAILGECVGQAMQLAKNDLTKVVNVFFEILVLNTARLLNGEAMGRVSADDMKKARAEFNKAKAEKAAKTKENNAKKVEDETAAFDALQEENEGLKAEIEELKKNVIDTAELINMIIASSATEEEKSAIIDFITGTKA